MVTLDRGILNAKPMLILRLLLASCVIRMNMLTLGGSKPKEVVMYKAKIYRVKYVKMKRINMLM